LHHKFCVEVFRAPDAWTSRDERRFIVSTRSTIALGEEHEPFSAW
jgi:hypothetical protein